MSYFQSIFYPNLVILACYHSERSVYGRNPFIINDFSIILRSVPYIIANLYCICESACFMFVKANALHKKIITNFSFILCRTFYFITYYCVLGASYDTVNLYCISVSACFLFVYADAAQIGGNIWSTLYVEHFIQQYMT